MVKYIREEWKTSQTIFREFSECFQMGVTSNEKNCNMTFQIQWGGRIWSGYPR